MDRGVNVKGNQMAYQEWTMLRHRQYCTNRT